MQRIHFTVQDLARTRLGPGCGPVAETAYALDLLQQGPPPVFRGWREQVSRRLHTWPWPRPSAAATRAGRALVDRAGPPDDPGLRRAWQLLVAPYWKSMADYLGTVREARLRAAIGGGVELLLTTLHPDIIWRPPVLEFPLLPDREIHLRGRGLAIRPAVFLGGPASILLPAEQPDSVVLVVATPPDPAQADWLWAAEEHEDGLDRLGALVGATRAAALKALTATCTTAQLAQRLGITSAGASQHATVLRRSGLITTQRVRNTALHTVTPLGLALLGSSELVSCP
ncbi:winged helix-turn-helix domain-containing protein [Dactylosporangium matsuzakiense]|uniref:Transcriptional regulator n=1 Tax=Dactylosporangium matsuzakiense TaxID=53360 RepID=A0A9W6KHY3_9ACTN|nr:winged helix-turn-helix domain-containing protein [Dactylosporangium matsuzakiense]UWZ42479.1 winged helix-turn-helix transcriptional regulator [Dactylosporangium matsuzakiense]GLL00606.1 transcriptional regulator [Dactylosporangium matsuzakiense]